MDPRFLEMEIIESKKIVWTPRSVSLHEKESFSKTILAC